MPLAFVTERVAFICICLRSSSMSVHLKAKASPLRSPAYITRSSKLACLVPVALFRKAAGIAFFD